VRFRKVGSAVGWTGLW